METPWGPIGYVTYKRTYARRLKDDLEETEEFTNTVDRVVDGCVKQLKIPFTDDEQKRLKEIFLSLKGSVAGRFLWQLGTKTVDDLGLMSLQNCAATIVDEPIKPFLWTADALMLGSGVGYNIQKEFVYELPKVRKSKISRKETKDADFIVPDSREGWIKLLKNVFESHFLTGENFTYSTICVRGKGTPIKRFGGTSSGPEELCKGVEDINTVLNNRAGKKARPIDCLDIMNIIGRVVVSGNVRRSAQIAIGDMDDLQFLNAKRWDLGNIPNWRAMSNNSVVCNDFDLLPDQFWQGYYGNGEPYGLINLNLARKVGRLNEPQYTDPDVHIFNPCAEQGLGNKETCCLAEIFLPNIESLEELKEVSKYLYIINKHSLSLKCHQKDTEKIVHKNMRMGIGVTGYLQASKKQRAWLSSGYEFLRKFDEEYSKKNGFNASIKLTTCKPSGTLSLLAGVTPGCHPAYSRFHVRRMRMASDSSLVDVCRKNKYPIEYEMNYDGTENKNTVVVSFPCSFPKDVPLARDFSAVDQLETVKEIQTNWSDNAVSCTVYYKKEELDSIKKWLKKNYNNSVKTISFLLHNEHGFKQAPLEEVSEDSYNKLMDNVVPIQNCNFDEDVEEIQECVGGACPIK